MGFIQSFAIPNTFFTAKEIMDNTDAPRILDLDQIASNPNQAKLSSRLHLFIMEHYHNFFTFMFYHQPYMLKSQFLDLFGYEKGNKNKSKSTGYMKLKELEEMKLIGVQSFYGAEYIYLSYRTYYYFGEQKKVLPIAPGENVLFRHFTRMEDYLEQSKKPTSKARLVLTMCSNEHYPMILSDQLYLHDLVEKELIIDPIQEKDTQFFGTYFPKSKPPKNFDIDFVTQFLSKTRDNKKDLWLINEEIPETQQITVFAFLDELFRILNTRCSIKLACNVEDRAIGIMVNIIPIPGTSYITIDNLISDIYHIEFLLKICYPKVKTIFNFIAMSTDHEEELHKIINRITTLRKNKQQASTWQKEFNPKLIHIRNTNIFKRFNFNDSYEAQRDKPLPN